jgi:hypothetical protein
MAKGGCFTEEEREIDLHKDESGGISSLHKFVIDKLHRNYTIFTEGVKEAQNMET